MRDTAEKRTKVTSLRMSEKQYAAIQKQAKKEKQTMSSFILSQAMHGKKGLTPAQMVKIQNVVNTACTLVREYATERSAALESEADALWSLLK